MISRTAKFSLAAIVAIAALGGGLQTLSTSTSTSVPAVINGIAAQDAAVAQTEVPLLAVSNVRPAVEVWKSPTCGCCEGWVSYLEDNGFPVTTHDTEDMDAVKSRLGLEDPSLKSCHTATIDGYVVEGHVPVSDIDKLLATRPDVVGISAPGMPMMSPGMGSLTPKDYAVVSFDKDGNQQVFSQH